MVSDGWLKVEPEENERIHFKLISDHPFNADEDFDVVELPISNWDAELEYCLMVCHQNPKCKSVMTDGSSLCYLLFY